MNVESYKAMMRLLESSNEKLSVKNDYILQPLSHMGPFFINVFAGRNPEKDFYPFKTTRKFIGFLSDRRFPADTINTNYDVFIEAKQRKINREYLTRTLQDEEKVTEMSQSEKILPYSMEHSFPLTDPTLLPKIQLFHMWSFHHLINA
jgi:hypothetical protein